MFRAFLLPSKKVGQPTAKLIDLITPAFRGLISDKNIYIKKVIKNQKDHIKRNEKVVDNVINN